MSLGLQIPGAEVGTASNLALSGEARGDLARRGAAAWAAFSAKAADTFVGGDGTDVVARTATQVATSLGVTGTAGHPSATGAFTSSRPTLTSGTTTVTLTGVTTAGQVFYATSTVGTYGLALGTALLTASVAGVYDGTAATLVTGGVVGCLFDAGLTSLTTGGDVYLSLVTAGRVTSTVPTGATNAFVYLGTIADGGSYNNGAGSVHAVNLRPARPLLL